MLPGEGSNPTVDKEGLLNRAGNGVFDVCCCGKHAGMHWQTEIWHTAGSTLFALPHLLGST